MARKKRSVVTTTVNPQADKTVPAGRYQDTFQQNVGKRFEEVGDSLNSNKRTILYALGALAVLLIVVGIYFSWSSRTNAAAQAALGKAIETSQATITTNAADPNSTGKQFPSAKERSQAAIPEFQAVVDEYGGAVEEKAKYFIAVNQLNLDRAVGVQQLEELSKNGGEVGTMAKFALAQTRVDDNRLDDAAALYKELADSSNSVIAKDSINLELARVYEKQGKKQEAIDVLFNIVKPASEAKDLEGKPVPLWPAAQTAKDKLKELDPERAKQIPEPASEAPDASQNNVP